MTIASAIKWSLLSELAAKAITPLTFVALARLLSPSDFGVVAAATLVISFCQVFWEAGMGKALIQDQGDHTAIANVAFWVNNVLAVIVAAFIVIAAPLVAEIVFRDSRVARVMQVMALHVLLSAASSVHIALLQKEMRFKRLFVVRLATVGAPALLSVPLAWYGSGYWALIVGAIVGQAAQVVILWRTVHWRPSWSFDIAVAKRLGRFGAWVAASALLGWFYISADSLVVGVYLGAHDLGLYRTANTLVIALFGFAFGPLLPVLYSHLSRIQHDTQRVSGTLVQAVRMITFIAIPSGFLLYALAEPIAEVVFGTSWQGVGAVIAVMALTHGFAWIVGANGEAYRAIGRPDYETKIMAFMTPLYVVGFALSAQHGFATFLWTRFALAMASVGVHLWVAQVAVALPARDVLAFAAKVSVVGIPLIALSYNSQVFGSESVWRLLAVAGCGGGWIVFYLWFIERKSLFPKVLQILGKGLTGNAPAGGARD